MRRRYSSATGTGWPSAYSRMASAVSGPTLGSTKRRARKAAVGAAAKASSEPPNSASSMVIKALRAGALRVVKAGGLDEPLQLLKRNRAQALDGERTSRTQIGERAFDGLPGGVLGQIRAEDHFKARFRRPPMLRAVGSEELVVHLAEALGGCGRLWWARLALE